MQSETTDKDYLLGLADICEKQPVWNMIISQKVSEVLGLGGWYYPLHFHDMIGYIRDHFPTDEWEWGIYEGPRGLIAYIRKPTTGPYHIEHGKTLEGSLASVILKAIANK